MYIMQYIAEHYVNYIVYVLYAVLIIIVGEYKIITHKLCKYYYYIRNFVTQGRNNKKNVMHIFTLCLSKEFHLGNRLKLEICVSHHV